MLSENSGIGLGMKIFQQNLIGRGTGSEAGTGISTDFAFDIGYLLKLKRLNFGLAITNIGPKISFIDVNQADPAPTNLRLGIQAELYNNNYNKVNLLFDVNKLLVASYPDMDWDGDGLIGGYDEDGAFGNVGSGIGLATVKKLVESMHGKVSISSTEGEGSNFKFSVPRH